MLLPSESVEGDVNVDVEVKTKNRFNIDLVDYIPLAERRRLAVSGCPLMWTANLPSASLAILRLLKEIFLADFGLTVMSVNSISPNKHTVNFVYARDSKISLQHPYSAMLQDGRVVEVMINTSKYSSSVQENSADFDEDKVMHKKLDKLLAIVRFFPVSDRQEYNFEGETEKCYMPLSTSGSYSLHENEIHNSTSEICQPVASAIPHHQKRIKLEPSQENDNDQNSKVIFEENTWCDPDLVTNSSPLALHVPVKKKPVDANNSNSFPQMVITSPKLLSEIAFHCGKCISTQRHSVCHPEKNPSIAEQNQATFDTNGQVSESSSTAFSFKVKPEPFVQKIDDVAFESLGKHSNGCSSYVLALKAVKMKVHEDIFVDELDCIPLRKRREMLLCKRAFDFKTSKRSQAFLNTENHYVKVKQCKCKKTATDSVETAMKEDAPGLLQVLIESGVDLKYIKLYKTMNDDDRLCALDEDASEDCFDEFGNIMAKV